MQLPRPRPSHRPAPGGGAASVPHACESPPQPTSAAASAAYARSAMYEPRSSRRWSADTVRSLRWVQGRADEPVRAGRGATARARIGHVPRDAHVRTETLPDPERKRDARAVRRERRCLVARPLDARPSPGPVARMRWRRRRPWCADVRCVRARPAFRTAATRGNAADRQPDEQRARRATCQETPLRRSSRLRGTHSIPERAGGRAHAGGVMRRARGGSSSRRAARSSRAPRRRAGRAARRCSGAAPPCARSPRRARAVPPRRRRGPRAGPRS